MPAGRPSTYKEEYIKRVSDYLEQSVDIWDEFHKTRGLHSDGYERVVQVKLPSREGFSSFVGVSHDALSDWEKNYPEFGVALRKIDKEQKERLINEGLGDNYNSTIAKLLLSANHGVVEKQNVGITGNGPNGAIEVHIKMI